MKQFVVIGKGETSPQRFQGWVFYPQDPRTGHCKNRMVLAASLSKSIVLYWGDRLMILYVMAILWMAWVVYQDALI